MGPRSLDDLAQKMQTLALAKGHMSRALVSKGFLNSVKTTGASRRKFREGCMTAQQPIPLRDRSGHIAPVCPAMVLGDKPGVRAEEITWGDDAMAGRILKAAQTPTSTSFYP
jgi:hypothetical protein